MAQSTNGVGHNSDGPLTSEQKRDLGTLHGRNIRLGRLELENAQLVVKVARQKVNGHFKMVAKDLGYTREHFEEILTLQDMPPEVARLRETERADRLADQGVASGEQMSLALGDTVDDKAEAHEDGRRAYLRCEDRDPPGKIATFLHPDWLAGWDEAMAEVIMRMGRATDLLAERNKPVGVMEADEEDEEPSLDPADIDKAARKLKKAGFLEPTAEEQTAPQLEDAA